MSEQLALLPGHLTAHLQLTLLALLVRRQVVVRREQHFLAALNKVPAARSARRPHHFLRRGRAVESELIVQQALHKLLVPRNPAALEVRPV